jgi:pimeloyl-ACP methyl ester carboxylesterase
MFGHAEGGRMAMLFAATFPEKTSALVLLDSFARRVRDNDYPWGVPEGFLPRLFERFDEGWGQRRTFEHRGPLRGARSAVPGVVRPLSPRTRT